MPSKKLDKKIKKFWIDALRSGNYEQIGGTLKDNDNRYCCLGVLCDVYSKKILKKKPNWVKGDHCDSFSYGKSMSDSVLPKPLQDKLGISDRVQEILYTMNDDEECSFAEISDYISKNL